MARRRVDEPPSIPREALRAALEIFHLHLSRVRLKHTEQRDTILRSFLEASEPLSPEELHLRVKRSDPGIGFTSVYRTLKLLTACGLATEAAFHGGIGRYEHPYNRRSHHLMVCTQCGGSVQFFSPEVHRLEQEIGRKYRYEVTRHSFEIYGLCEGCRRRSSRRVA